MLNRLILAFMRIPIKPHVPALAACLLWATAVQAQNYVYTSNQPAADKIVSVVGDKIILQSDIQQQLSQLRQNQGPLPPDVDCFLLSRMIEQNVLVLQAEKDSLPVSDEEVEQNLEHRVRYFVSMYGSQEKMEQELGKSIYQIKDQYRPDIKDILLSQAMEKKIQDQVKITPTEVEAFFNSIPKDSLPFFESEVEVGQIVIKPDPSPDVVRYTVNQLNSLRQQADSGGKSFDVLATLYSKDLATGGNVLTVDRTQKMFDPQFVAAAFRLKDGEISPVVKTQFGYHILQLVSREGNIAKVRHILLIPPITSGDIAKAEQELDSIRANILAGKITFGEAATKYSDDDNFYTGTKKTGGMFTMQDESTFMDVKSLDPGIVLMLDSLKVGSISAPVVFTPDQRMPEQKAVRIVYLKSRSKPHRMSLQEDYSRIQAEALRQKQDKVMQEWYDKHVPDFYLDVDSEYAKCEEIARWLKTAHTPN